LKGYVVDASVAVKWLIPEEYSEKAMKLLEAWVKQELELNAPRLLRLEVTNALTKYAARGLLKVEQLVQGFQIFREIAITYSDEDWQLIEEALNASTTMDLSIYDAIYIVLAKKLNATLITADGKLVDKIKLEMDVLNIKDLS